jgi:HNH endonuclease/AP2 domain-containing protein
MNVIVIRPMPCGRVFKFDLDDYEKVDRHPWQSNRYGYARACIGTKKQNILLHRFLLDAPTTLEVDHINGNRLDNRRSNLRLSTSQTNAWNRRPKNGNRFKGIRRRTQKRWLASIYFENKQITIGNFDSPEEAARAYDVKAKELFGEFARLNFPK